MESVDLSIPNFNVAAPNTSDVAIPNPIKEYDIIREIKPNKKKSDSNTNNSITIEVDKNILKGKISSVKKYRAVIDGMDIVLKTDERYSNNEEIQEEIIIPACDIIAIFHRLMDTVS